MTIEVRLPKLKFLVEEMQIALHLAKHAPDAFVARTLARHILIRAENFIAHARGLRKPLNVAGYDTRGFHKAKEAYAKFFDEYFQVSRDRLGAHVQDFDFGRRIELWNDIEIIKISFFVEGASEIYGSLASVGIPGYVTHSEPPELQDASLTQLLTDFQRSNDNRQWVELGVDPLAMTRDRTTAALNMTPIHARAGQLALIRRWVSMQLSLIEKLGAFSHVARIVKARVITDIVSFCDCLVTRAVPPSAPQAMDGLDRLIAGEGQSAAPIAQFVAASNFDTELAALRTLRDRIGAHLEIDDAAPVGNLTDELERYDLHRGRQFFELVNAAFAKACFGVLYLRMYAADGQRLYGIAANTAATVPFSQDATSPAYLPTPQSFDDEEAYRQNLTRWLDGDDAQKGDSRQFFWNAFMHSEVVEEIVETEPLGAGSYRNSFNEYRKAHAFLETFLRMPISDSDFYGTMDLLRTCARGYPYALSEMLVRSAIGLSDRRRAMICYMLGEVRSWPHKTVDDFLTQHSIHALWGMRQHAILARYKIFIGSEGLYRLNHKGQIAREYGPFADALTGSVGPEERFLCFLAFASILSGATMGSLAQPFRHDYEALQKELLAVSATYLKGGKTGTNYATAVKLVGTHDYVGLSLQLAIDIEQDPRTPFGEALLNNCCEGTVETAWHEQASRHLAMCFIMKKEYQAALGVARSIASRNPEDLKAQMFVTQILVEAPDGVDEAAQQIARIRASYKIDPGTEAALSSLEQQLLQRSTSSLNGGA